MLFGVLIDDLFFFICFQIHWLVFIVWFLAHIAIVLVPGLLPYQIIANLITFWVLVNPFFHILYIKINQNNLELFFSATHWELQLVGWRWWLIIYFFYEKHISSLIHSIGMHAILLDSLSRIEDKYVWIPIFFISQGYATHLCIYFEFVGI